MPTQIHEFPLDRITNLLRLDNPHGAFRPGGARHDHIFVPVAIAPIMVTSPFAGYEATRENPSHSVGIELDIIEPPCAYC